MYFIFVLFLSSACLAEITIDGKLTEKEWQNVHAYTGWWSTVPNDNQLSRYYTELKAFADHEALYLAVVCEHPDISNISSEKTGRDALAWMDESVEIFLQPNLSKKGYAHIAINTNATIFDEWTSRGPKSWTHKGLQAECKKYKDAGFYVIEVKIPFDKFGSRPENNKKWGFNIIRTLKQVPTKTGEISTWSALQIGAHEPENFGKIEFKKNKIILSRKVPHIAPASPLIPNWSFEKGLKMWKRVMFVGGRNYAAAKFTVSKSSISSPVGAQCLHIKGRNVQAPLIEHARGGVKSTAIKLNAGEYELIGYYRTKIKEDGRVDRGYVSALIQGTGGKYLGEKFIEPTERWRRFSIPFVVFKRSSCSVMLRLWSNGDVWFDAIEIVRAESRDTSIKSQAFTKQTIKCYGKPFELLTPEPQKSKISDKNKLVVYNRWPIDSLHPTSAPQTCEQVKSINISACKGEMESTPLALYATHDLKNVKMILKPISDNKIPEKWFKLDNVTFWKQRTAYTSNELHVVPELLRSVKNYSIGKIAAKHTLLTWLTFKIPLDVSPGKYSAKLLITSNKSKALIVPVTLEVHPFKLPKPPLVFGLWIDLYTPPGRAIYPFMKAYGVTAATFPFEYDISIKNGKVVLDSSKGIEALKGYRDADMTGPVPLELSALSTRLAKELGIYDKIKRDGTHDSSSLICPLSSKDYPKELRAAYRQSIKQIRDSISKAELTDMVMLYPVDEPTGNPHRMPKMLVESQIIRQVWPDVKIFTTTHDLIRTRRLKGLLDVPCVSLSYLGRSQKWNNQFRKMAEECDMQLWTYGGTMMEKYWPIRALGFRAAFAGAKTMLGWVAHYASANPRNPNDDLKHRIKQAATFYPDGKTFVSTIQWEALREAVDDTRYLAKAQMVIEELKKANNPLGVKFDRELKQFRTAILNKSLKSNKDCNQVRKRLIEIINSVNHLQK